jgi:gamma-glutamyl hydrolase
MSSHAIAFRVLCAALALCSSGVRASQRPIIGILSTPQDLSAYPQYTSYIPAGYVKWLESGGARVVALPFDAPASALDDLFPYLNGFLFTGGGATFVDSDGLPNLFSNVANRIFQYSRSQSIPLWGTCQGIQLLGFLASNMAASVPATGFDSENLTLPLDFEADAQSSRLWSVAPQEIFAAFADSSLNISYNAHHNGITLEQVAAMTLPVRVLSTNLDRVGRLFVSSFEFVDAPITGVQFHPERVIYEVSALGFQSIPFSDRMSLPFQTFLSLLLVPLLVRACSGRRTSLFPTAQ